MVNGRRGEASVRLAHALGRGDRSSGRGRQRHRSGDRRRAGRCKPQHGTHEQRDSTIRGGQARYSLTASPLEVNSAHKNGDAKAGTGSAQFASAGRLGAGGRRSRAENTRPHNRTVSKQAAENHEVADESASTNSTQAGRTQGRRK